MELNRSAAVIGSRFYLHLETLLDVLNCSSSIMEVGKELYPFSKDTIVDSRSG